MRALYLALKDLTQIFRDRKAALFLVLMPIVLTGLLGVALRGDGATDRRLPIALANADATGPLGAAITPLLESSGALRVVAVSDASPESALAEVQAKRAVAAVVVPVDFSRRTLAGEPIPLRVIVDETSSTGQAARDAARNALTRVYSAGAVARVRADLRAKETPFATDAVRAAALNDLAAKAAAAWQTPPLATELVPAGALSATASAFRQSSPGMLVMFALFSLTLSAAVVVAERRSGTLQRLLTTSVGRAEILAGHVAAMFAVVFGQGLLLVAVGQFGFGVDYLRSPLATLLVLAALALWVACLGLLIGVAAKGQEQVGLFGMIAMFVLSALGGAWFPLEGTGAAFSAVGHLLPSAWAMVGFQDVVVRGLALDAALLPVGVMLAYAAGFFGLAVWRFQTVE